MAVKLCGSGPGIVMKLRRGCGLKEWRAEAGRTVRSIALDIVVDGGAGGGKQTRNGNWNAN